MNHQTKKMILDAFIKTVDSAPTRKNTFYQQGVTEDSFKNWMNYVNSVFQITSQYLDTNLLLVAYNSIQNIAMQPNMDYALKTNDICQEILNFARSILSM